MQRTLWGNLILGPTARDVLKFNEHTGKYEEDPAVSPAALLRALEVAAERPPRAQVVNAPKNDVLRYIFSKCQELVPTCVGMR